MKRSRLGFGVLLLMVTFPGIGFGQDSAETVAINRLIDEYVRLEDARDMSSQSKLMTPDRVWIGAGTGRRSNQAMNMQLQQAGFDARGSLEPGVVTFTEARDRQIRVYGGGTAAVASFYWYQMIIPGPDTPPAVAATLTAPTPLVFTIVLVKEGGDWKIAHTHNSRLVLAS